MKKNTKSNEDDRVSVSVLRRQFRPSLRKGGVGSIAIKLGNTALGLFVAVLLARTLGTEGYGIYAYVFAIVSVLSVPAGLGLPNLLVRETAKAEAREDWGLMRGVWRWATGAALCVSLFVGTAAFGVYAIFFGFSNSEIKETLLWGLVLLPFMTLAKVRDGALRGLRRVVQGQVSDSIIRPLLFLLMTGIAFLASGAMTPALAMSLHTLAAGLAFLFGLYLLWRARPAPLTKELPLVLNRREWISSALPLGMTGAMHMINSHADIIILGWYAGSHDVGVYRVATQGASVALFGLQAINMVVSPYFSKVYTGGDFGSLQRLATLGARAAFLITVPIALTFLVFGVSLIGFVFGKQFSAGYVPLAILCGGQVLNALFGSVGALLNMTGHEFYAARGVTIGAFANLVLNVLFIPMFGLVGAATATVVSLLIWNIILWREVICKLGIDSTALGLWGKGGYAS